MGSSFRIVIMGDSSSSSSVINSKVLNTLFTKIKELWPQPKFIFFVGDMVYGCSNINEELKLWKDLIEKYYPITICFPTFGNHDSDENAFSNAFSYLPNKQLAGYQRTVYYFDYENARFIVLNSNHNGKYRDPVINKDQRIWLENVLHSSNKKYNFVLFHAPAFPSGHHYGNSLDSNHKERDALWSILDSNNVSAVFTGHEHNYCRRLIDKSFSGKGNLLFQNSIYQITTGGAGTSLNAHITDIRNVKVGPLPIYHYSVLDISDNYVTLQAYDKENNLIDSCCIFPYNVATNSTIKDDIIIPIGGEWKYLDNGSNQGSSWINPSFDDSKWLSGLAELGYGDGGETTIVSYGPNVYKKYITTYFRKQFYIDDASIYNNLTISIQRDDGAVIYLNGKEVFRTNMPAGVISYDTLASKALDGSAETSYEKAIVDGSLIRTGYNVLAVEIHQASSSSSDISFNLQLVGHKKL